MIWATNNTAPRVQDNQISLFSLFQSAWLGSVILYYQITFKLLHQVKHNVITLLTDSSLKLQVLLKKKKMICGWLSLRTRFPFTCFPPFSITFLGPSEYFFVTWFLNIVWFCFSSHLLWLYFIIGYCLHKKSCELGVIILSLAHIELLFL